MAAVGRAARAQIKQLCAATQRIRVAGFRTASQAVLDRSQSASVPNFVPAAMAWEAFSVTYPAWYRVSLSGMILLHSFCACSGTSVSMNMKPLGSLSVS